MSWRVRPLIASRFRLDGGAMFGVIPKPLWSRVFAADDRNRIELVCRILLLVDTNRVVIVDTGMGDAWTAKEREIYALADDGGLDAALAGAGHTPSEVTDVVLTHLHFDHAGGITRADGSLRFPNAVHHVQATHLAWARAPSPKDAGSFRRETLGAMDVARLRILEGEGAILPGVTATLSGGHTEALQIVTIDTPEGPVVFAADLVPTRAHLHPPWMMAYDNHPILCLSEKTALFARLAATGARLVLEHDPEVEAVTIRRDADRWIGDPAAI
jgi:glyoxylase-like metal-dependent hydrolase (beta-lactamase superfamily II)